LKKGQIDTSGIRFFIGYSGWTQGQLPNEMEQKSWLTAEATRKIVFHRNLREVWKTAVTDLGGDYSMMANFPTDPQLN
jgi:putative transcriptional regulator